MSTRRNASFRPGSLSTHSTRVRLRSSAFASARRRAPKRSEKLTCDGVEALATASANASAASVFKRDPDVFKVERLDVRAKERENERLLRSR